jgi:hypothetical protein
MRKDQNCLEPAPETDGDAAPTTDPGHQRRSTGLEKVSLYSAVLARRTERRADAITRSRSSLAAGHCYARTDGGDVDICQHDPHSSAHSSKQQPESAILDRVASRRYVYRVCNDALQTVQEQDDNGATRKETWTLHVEPKQRQTALMCSGQPEQNCIFAVKWILAPLTV